MLNKRSELYGESVFTSFRSYSGKVPGLDYHLERLRYSVSQYYLFRDLSLEDFEVYFQVKKNLIKKLEEKRNSYFRITIYADDTSEKLGKIKFGLSELKVQITNSELPKISTHLEVNTIDFSFNYLDPKIKSGSYFQNLQIKRSALNIGFSDSLLINEDKLCELSTSNIILERNGRYITPAGKNIFRGVTVLLFAKYCFNNNINFTHSDIRLSEITSRDKIYALNSVAGAICINQINDLELNRKKSKLVEGFRLFLEESV